MKNIFILKAMFLLNIAFVFGQSCDIDSSYTGSFSPDTLIGLPEAEVGIAYEGVIHVNVPTDTVVLGMNADINWFKVDSVSGLPDGFDYVCNPVSCMIEGGERACAVVYGTPNEAMSGMSYRFTVHITGSVTGDIVPGFPVTQEIPIAAEGYSIDVAGEPQEPQSIAHYFNDFTWAQGDQFWSFNLVKDFNGSVRLFDVNGRMVVNQQVEGNTFFINHNHLVNGIYVAQFIKDGVQHSVRVTKY